jgi:serine/threonine protein kinase
MPNVARQFVVGDRVPGTKWVVQAKLGEGGMGVVYGVVKDPGIEGAMKVMLPPFAKNPAFVARFLSEARLLAKLRHPNIVQVIDFDQLADGAPFVVMERLQGRTLRAAMRAMQNKGGISPSLAYEIVRQLCEGLHSAHSRDPRIIHRDVKPENVFVHVAASETVLIKLLDFGIATVASGKQERQALGTPRYMAPELLLGQPASPQSDIYSAALVLYQMLTGRFPWDVDLQSTSAMAHAHLQMSPEPPSRFAPWLPPVVDGCIVQALAKDPAARPHSAYEFSARLCLLQFVGDARSKDAVDVNTTAPTLATLADAIGELTGNDAMDTLQGMTPPPVDGASLEFAPPGILGATEPVASLPSFSTSSVARGAAATTRPHATVDRLSTTPTMLPITTRVPTHGTAEIYPIEAYGGAASAVPIHAFPTHPEVTAATEPPPMNTPMVSATTALQGPANTSTRSQSLNVLSVFALTVACGLTLVEWSQRAHPLAPPSRSDGMPPKVPTSDQTEAVPSAAPAPRNDLATSIRSPGPAKPPKPASPSVKPRLPKSAWRTWEPPPPPVPSASAQASPDDGRDLLNLPVETARRP